MKNEITSLIEEVALKLSIQIGKPVEFSWDGGQKGSYYICDFQNLNDFEVDLINKKLDGLSSAVSKFLQENDLQEEDLWN